MHTRVHSPVRRLTRCLSAAPPAPGRPALPTPHPGPPRARSSSPACRVAAGPPPASWPPPPGPDRTPSAPTPTPAPPSSSREEVRATEVPGARGGVGGGGGGGQREGEAARGLLAGTSAVGALLGRARGEGGAGARPRWNAGVCGEPLPASDSRVVAGSPPCCDFRPVSRPSGWWERSSCHRRSFSWSGHPSGISLLWPTPRAR